MQTSTNKQYTHTNQCPFVVLTVLSSASRRVKKATRPRILMRIPSDPMMTRRIPKLSSRRSTSVEKVRRDGERRVVRCHAPRTTKATDSMTRRKIKRSETKMMHQCKGRSRTCVLGVY